ncbi:MAG: hypothetical protein KatS3mg044_0373 [Rhodothermaceae bacterium]|nr:MAG: hypothetical protein KatS3mg044_0373 [Rhodothermaceae bacterium]
MIHLSRHLVAPVVLAALLLTGCDDLFGTKSDETTREIFEAGRTEPGVLNEVEYVPLFPFFSRGGDGAPLEAPTDIYAGYDELLYVTDARGLHVLDRAGRPATFLPIDGGATSVTQDRRFHVYVTARRDTTLNGRTWNLPVVLHYDGLTTGTPRLVDIIWHPFDDDSRRFNRPDPIETDEQVAFTGVGVLANNNILVARRGPVNDLTSVILPHNTVLEFSPDGVNVQAIVALNPTLPSLRSAVNPADIITFVQPPQRTFFPSEKNFVLAQSPYPDGEPPPGGRDSLRFAVLSIQAVVTPDGIEYRPDTEKLQAAANPDRGDGFLYDEFRFENPTDLMFAADGTNYLFVTDAGKDSLFVFTAQGIEGVAPPPGATSTRPVIVSFGGTGDGARQFRDPMGVGYFDRIVYVADRGNNRISRFRLNTDFE